MDLGVFSDEHFMKEALKEAHKAFEIGEVPIGAVVVSNNKIIGRGHNQVETLRDATAHAEMIAITSACNHLGNKILENCSIFITVEPCLMCAGALRWVRLGKVVFGTEEPKAGFMSYGINPLHPRADVIRGVMREECQSLIKEFFLNKRKLGDD